MVNGTIDVHVVDVQAGREHVSSKADLALIGDLVFRNIMRQLPAHQLIQIPGQQWSVWGNLQDVAEARRKDDTRDWYFPIHVWESSSWSRECIPLERFFTWSGIWHPTANDAIEKVSRLPPMTFLLEDWQHARFPLCEIVASDGGLILVKARRWCVPVRRSRRINKSLAYSVPTGLRRLGRGHPNDCSTDWDSLLVCNPMTRECRELPEAKCADMGWTSWNEVYREGVRGAHMEVDDEANSYQVILIFCNFVAVFKSTTDSWNCVQFQASSPWDGEHGNFYRAATALVGRRLYAADIDSARFLDADAEAEEGDVVYVGCLRLFHADIEAGSWTLVHECYLRWSHMRARMHESLSPYVVPLDEFLVNVQLVECMGSLYAVIPSWMHHILTIGERPVNHRDFELPPWNEQGSKYTPLVFNLVRLDGELDEDNALLRLPVRTPDQTAGDMSPIMWQIRETRGWGKVCDSWGRKPFTCKVRGSVIWVMFQDSLLSFDVVSGKHTVRFLDSERTEHCHRSGIHRTKWVHFSFRPSFHMKP